MNNLFRSNGVFSHKGMKIFTHATTWSNLKNFVLSERSQTQKALSGKGKILGMENRSVAAGVRAEYNGAISGDFGG